MARTWQSFDRYIFKRAFNTCKGVTVKEGMRTRNKFSRRRSLGFIVGPGEEFRACDGTGSEFAVSIDCHRLHSEPVRG